MQKLQLTIPEPCHENWQHMTPTEQGRFCNACAKEVIDFSMMTDAEVLNYFTAITHEKVCGRALPSQLHRNITKPKEPKKRLFWYWNYVVMFFMFFGKGNVAKAQGNVKATTVINPVKTNHVNRSFAKMGQANLSDSIVISGKVIDKDGSPVSYATIKIKGTNGGVSADVNGNYFIKVKYNDILVISGGVYLSSEINVASENIITTVLQKSLKTEEIKISVVLGGIRFTDPDEEKIVSTVPEFTAAFRIKDEKSELPVANAELTMVQTEIAGGAMECIISASSITKIK